ncbi:MAG: DUF3168 domain-containing protein [Gammaproteobacteria bacterium]|nr:DUF3168 domain-containing protein [Gammaproteobacteria bacterium]
MTVQSTLFSTLSTDGDVSALVAETSSPVIHRIYPNVAPDNVARPYLIYMVIADTLPVVFNDVINIREYILQIDCYATTADGAQVLADHVVDAVNTGMKLVQVFNIGSDYDDDVKLYRYICQLTVWH